MNDLRTYAVAGMTCGHCVASVTEEVQAIPGVETVEVVLESGTLSVAGSRSVNDDAVKAAVEEAGYQLA